MTNSAKLFGTRFQALFFALLLLACVLLPSRALAQSDTQLLSTTYFTIFYPHGEEKAAAWYAGFADDVDQAVSDMLGSEPVLGIRLRIYATEADYSRANPMAETHPGIMAHAIPELKEVGVAVERLRQVPPELARESFRHEITHIVAAALSDNNLPVGFQEGLAQYNELSGSRAQEVATALKGIMAGDGKLLSWAEMNDRAAFSRNIEVAYPQSYTIMAFLADRYGMDRYSRLLRNLREGNSLNDSLAWAYAEPADKLEAEWRAYLPTFLKDGWRVNVLQAYDLGPAQALFDAGRYAEAQPMLERSEQLYRDLGKSDKADEIATLKAQAVQAQSATDLLAEARKALLDHDYARAQSVSGLASLQYAGLHMDDRGRRAGDAAQLAGQGLEAVALLDRAQKHVQSWDFMAAETEAAHAGKVFSRLGDEARVAEVNSLLAGIWSWRQAGGLGALGAGGVAVLLGGLALVRSRRRSYAVQRSVVAEEATSWL